MQELGEEFGEDLESAKGQATRAPSLMPNVSSP